MIFVTGDTHGGIDISKLANKQFPENRMLCKNDYVIITGDFGFVWDGGKQDKYWLKWLKERNFTTLFIDGNHENFDIINSYSVDEWNGGKVHFINDSVIHLMRGQVFKIDGSKFFTFGGADSYDKEFRKEGKSWWKQELPTEKEYKEGMSNLAKHNWDVDFIITHTCPSSISRILGETLNKKVEVLQINDYLEEILSKTIYKCWFSGHEHVDINITESHRIVYQNVIKLF